MKSRKCIAGPAYSLLAALYSLTPVTIYAAADNIEPANWAYSSIFGTGWYQIENNQSVFAVSLPVRQTLRQSSITDSGERKIGIEIDYALSLGLYNVDNLSGIIHPDNFASIVFTPGVELEIPVSQSWYLRPYANFGWGTKLGSSDSAWIYHAGLKSRYTLPVESGNWTLINSILYAGYSPDKGPSNDLAAILAGIEYRQPLKHRRLSGEAVDLHWSFSYTYLGDELTFGLTDGNFDAVNDQLEAAVSYGYRNRPIKLWFMSFDTLGLGYRTSSNGTFKGVSLNLGSWFTR